MDAADEEGGSVTAEGVKFNRKRDRMAFKQDLTKPTP